MSNPFALFTNKHRSIVSAIAVVTGATVIASSSSAAVFAMAQPSTAMDTSTMQPAKAGESQAATDLRVAMNNLLREHVSSSLDVTRSIAEKAPQAQIDGAMNAQYANSDALSAAIGSIYGSEAQNQFSELFKEHIMQSNHYAMAVSNDDQAAKQAALMELQTYLNQIATFFSTAIPGLQMQVVYGLLNEHEELINKSTEAYKAGDFVQSYQLEREALKQISGAADALSSGIIATQPAKFE